MIDIFEPKDFIIEDGYNILGNHLGRIGIPKNAPTNLKKYLVAAQVAYFQGYSSIDYILKRYGDNFEVSPKMTELEELLSKITDSIRSTYRRIIERRMSINGKLPDYLGLFAAGAALIRLEVSFKSACFLCDKAFNFEALSIGKLILEQIAWSYAVHNINDDKVFKIKPPKAISCLKDILPNVGWVYGHLNKEAHLDPQVHKTLVTVENEYPKVILHDSRKSLQTGLLLLILVDFYGIIMEVIYREFMEECEFIIDESGKFKPNPNRELLAVMKEMNEEVTEFLKRKE